MDRRRRSASASYRNAVLATSPLGYWRLGEASGTVARDEMGANHGTYVGSPTLGAAGLLAGDADGAVALDGITQCVTCAAPPAMTACSGAVWFTRAGAPNGTGDKTITALLTTITGYAGYPRVVIAEADGRPRFQWLDSASALHTVTAAAPAADGSPHFIVGTHDGVTGRLYVDGVPSGTPAAFDLHASAAAGVVVGRAAAVAGVSQANGTIDEPAIWSRALTAAEIADLYRIGRGLA